MKRFIFIFCFLTIFTLIADAQKRKYVLPELNYTADIVSNFSGGDKQTTQMMGLIEAGIVLNSDSAQLWKGGIFNLEMIHTHGKGITNTTLHDLQGISNIEAGNHTLLAWELWYHQQIGKLGVRSGLLTVSNDFMLQSFTTLFSGGSYAVYPTLSQNYSLANYPAAGLGVSLSYELNRNLFFLTSLFDGEVSNLDHDHYNTQWGIDIKDGGLLSVSELKYTSDSSKYLTSAYGLGLAFHTKDFPSVEIEGKNYTHNYTVYAFGEHDLYRVADKSAGVFLQASYAPKDRNPAYLYTSAGFVMNGFFTSSHADNVGIGLTQLYYQEFDKDILKNRLENSIEAYFMYPINKYLSVKPTFTTIISSSKTTVTAGMVRLYINIF